MRKVYFLLPFITLFITSHDCLSQIDSATIAKYVCIIQGFIGWFLLSIFTVALINQVLF
jgi:hypothetical protein